MWSEKNYTAVISLSKIWIDISVTDPKIQIENYFEVRRDRGRLCCFVKTNLASIEIVLGLHIYYKRKFYILDRNPEENNLLLLLNSVRIFCQQGTKIFKLF